MINPNPEKYYTLREAFNVLGRGLFPETWTDSELDARDLPELEDLRRRIEKAEAAAKKKADEERVKRAEHAKQAKKASVGVHAGPETPGRSD